MRKIANVPRSAMLFIYSNAVSPAMQNTLTHLAAFAGESLKQPPAQQLPLEAEASASLATRFSILVEEHSRLLFRIALAITRHPQDAEDAVQEAFLQLYRTSNWEKIDDHRAYLARIAWRMAVRRRTSKPRQQEQQFPDSMPSQVASPEDDAIDQQSQRAMHQLIDQLPEKLRQPLALSGLGELSHVEIARILNLPEGTVRRRIHTARQKLRAQWNQQTGGKA